MTNNTSNAYESKKINEFITITGEFRHEYIVEKSKFITTLCPCSTEQEAQQFISRINKEFWDAHHNCTAFALGPCQEQQRSSDNGEPSGTAGKPMLEVLKKTGITNIAVVVTRYFGGIKLGAGGLIRAYSTAVSSTVQLAPKELHTQREQLQATVDYGNFGAIKRYLANRNLSFTSDFGESVTLLILVTVDEVDTVITALQNMTGGTITYKTLGLDNVVLPYTIDNE